jgi:hypothetical protein
MIEMNRTVFLLTSFCVFFLLSFAPVHAQAPGKRYALLIAGLGGAPEYTQKYHDYLYQTRKAFTEVFDFPAENVIVLADSRTEQENFIDDISTAENIKTACSSLSNRVTPEDDVYIILFGHGSFDGKNSMLNIPQADLKDTDYANLVGSIHARRLIFINTASCSSPFVTHLSGPGRIVITATKSETERNETVFPQFLVEALKSNVSDRDKNGDLSVFEIFQYASERTASWFKEGNHLETEHPILEDTGDKRGFRAEELDDNKEGALSKTTYLLEKTRQILATMETGKDSVLVRLLNEQETINQEITTLMADRAKYPEKEYLSRLEPLFIRLAAINDEIDNRK